MDGLIMTMMIIITASVGCERKGVLENGGSI